MPRLAQKWEPNADATVWRFTLNDALFHDGKKLTPEDVLFNFGRILDPKATNHFAQSLLSVIAGRSFVTERFDDHWDGGAYVDELRILTAGADARGTALRGGEAVLAATRGGLRCPAGPARRRSAATWRQAPYGPRGRGGHTVAAGTRLPEEFTGALNTAVRSPVQQHTASRRRGVPV